MESKEVSSIPVKNQNAYEANAGEEDATTTKDTKVASLINESLEGEQ